MKNKGKIDLVVWGIILIIIMVVIALAVFGVFEGNP